MKVTDLLWSDEEALLRDMLRRRLAEPVDDADAVLEELGLWQLAGFDDDGCGALQQGMLQAVAEELGRARLVTNWAAQMAAVNTIALADPKNPLKEALTTGAIRVAIAAPCESVDLGVVEHGATASVICVPWTQKSAVVRLVWLPTSALAPGDEATTTDGQPGARLSLRDALGPDAPRSGPTAAERLFRIREAFDLWELTGICARLLDETVDYAQSRQQFGRPIAKFQALQHGIAAMWIALEEIRSMALAARAALSPGAEPEALARTMGLAWIAAVPLARQIAQSAIQYHGGMGVAEEYTIAPLARRAWFLTQRQSVVRQGPGALADQIDSLV